MAISFPSNPAVGQEYEAAGKTWVWTGSTWDAIGVSGGAGGGGGGFYVNVVNVNNTTYTFEDDQPAGVYQMTSAQNDYTFDLYAVTASGLPAGFLRDGRKLVATSDFRHLVIYGATAGDLLDFDYKTTVSSTTSGNMNGGAGPFLTSVTPSVAPGLDDTVTLTGGNFATNVVVTFIGTDNVELPAKSIVRTSSTQLIVTVPDAFDPTTSPYDVKVENPGILSPQDGRNILSNVVSGGTFPTWQTPGGLFWEKGTTTQLALVASDAENSDVDYQIIAGSLFAGFTLNAETGVVTGDDSLLATGDNCRFTVRATDTGGYTVDREFEIWIDQVPVNSFYFDSFVNAGRLDLPLLFEFTLDT